MTTNCGSRVSYDQANRLLDILIDRDLIEEPPDGMLRFNDLARAHARSLAEQMDRPEGCRQALERIAEWMLQAAVIAAVKLNPNRWWLGRYFQPEHRPEPMAVGLFLDFSDRVDALEWLVTCHQALFSVAEQSHTEGLHHLTCEIVEATWPLFTHRKLYSTWINIHQLGVQAAKAYGDVRMQARMLLGLAAAYENLHEFDRATHHANQALDLARQAGHREGEGSALEILGVAAMATGRPDEAIEHFAHSRTIHWELARTRGAGLMTRHIGEALAKAGRYTEATEYFTVTLLFFSADEEPYLRARTLSGLADAHLNTSRFDQAEPALHESLSLCRNLSSYHEEAGVLVMMARLAKHRGNTTSWRTKLESALRIYTQLDAPQASEITEQLSADPPS